jgi:hypothetical protein
MTVLHGVYKQIYSGGPTIEAFGGRLFQDVKHAGFNGPLR